MARTAITLSVGNYHTQHISLGVLALCVPLREIQRLMEACG